MDSQFYDKEKKACKLCGCLMPDTHIDISTHTCNPYSLLDKKTEKYQKEEEMEAKKDIIVAPVERQPAILTAMENPEKAVEIYDSIKKHFYQLIKDNGEIIKVKGKDYVKYEGWQTVGTALGILPRVVEITAIDGGFQAKAEAVLVKTGQVVGQAYALCTKDEANWKDKPMFALMAMAQTRASGRALKMILSGFISHLGWEATPAEELDGVINGNGEEHPVVKHTAVENFNLDGSKTIKYTETTEAKPAGGCTDKQQKAIYAILKGQDMSEESIIELLESEYGVQHSRELSKSQASEIIDKYGTKR